uniref:FAR1 domain-containing protein n=1 Tax=Panagrellus redivivus TaxID=6233 RepID=A0A7E4VFH4_PANRE
MSNAENIPMVPSASPDADINDIFQGAKFRDYHEFSAVFGAYQERTHTVYKVDGSELLKDPNNPDLVEKYKYSHLVFKCQHGKPRQRGTGKRQHNNTLKLGCQSRLRLNLNRATMIMEVTVWFDEHNHVCVPPQFDAKGRRILPQVIPYTPEVLAAKKVKSNRPTPYSRQARAPLAPINTSLPLASAQHSVSEDESGNSTTPIVSTEPSPRLEKLNQDLFNFLNPKSEAERVEEWRNEMKAHLEFIKNSIPLHDTQGRLEVSKKLVAILKLISNIPVVLAWEQALNMMPVQLRIRVLGLGSEAPKIWLRREDPERSLRNVQNGSGSGAGGSVQAPEVTALDWLQTQDVKRGSIHTFHLHVQTATKGFNDNSEAKDTRGCETLDVRFKVHMKRGVEGRGMMLTSGWYYKEAIVTPKLGGDSSMLFQMALNRPPKL